MTVPEPMPTPTTGEEIAGQVASMLHDLNSRLRAAEQTAAAGLIGPSYLGSQLRTLGRYAEAYAGMLDAWERDWIAAAAAAGTEP